MKPSQYLSKANEALLELTVEGAKGAADLVGLDVEGLDPVTIKFLARATEIAVESIKTAKVEGSAGFFMTRANAEALRRTNASIFAYLWPAVVAQQLRDNVTDPYVLKNTESEHTNVLFVVAFAVSIRAIEKVAALLPVVEPS